jgi:hypothetical protein
MSTIASDLVVAGMLLFFVGAIVWLSIHSKKNAEKQGDKD